MKKRHIILPLCLCLFPMAQCQQVMAQQTTTQNGTIAVTGTVIDGTGESVIGATIQVVGNPKISTVTDIEGKFKLNVPAKSKIKISYIGSESVTLSKFEPNMTITLKEDENMLDEVVAVGYGALKQKNVTGSIEIINPEELHDLNVSSLSEALIGLSPSIHVSMPGTGRPGEQASITIRQARDAVALVPTGKDEGGQSIGGDNNAAPLYVIDEFISTEDDFNNLDIDEVESIAILKDASAAVYGAYGAYGVILVKTKRGQVGTPKISYTGQFGFQDAVRHADMLNGQQYGYIYNAARRAKAIQDNSSIDMVQNYFQADELEAMRNTNYNLLDDYWKSALTQKHGINVSGGNEKVTYFGGVTYQTQDGNIGKLDYDRWNYRAGINAKVAKLFTANLSVSGDALTKNTHLGKDEEDYEYMMKNPSYIPDEINGYPIYHSGMKNDPAYENFYNYKSLNRSRNNREQSDNSMTIQASLEHDFSWCKPLKGLRAKLTYSKNVNNSKRNDIKMENVVYRMINRGGSGKHLYITDPNAIIDNDPLVDYDEVTLEGFPYVAFENFQKRTLNEGSKSYLSRTMSTSKSYQLNFMLMYMRDFGKHHVSGTFSIERGESESENVEAKGTHPLSFTDGQSNSLSDDSEKTVQWGRQEGGSLAYIGRLNYAYDNKYLFEFLIRSQASTKFAPENYWGAFPSFSAGWVISEEPWFNKEKLKIDYLKIRGSFGIMGRDNVEAWRWLQLYSYNEYGGAIFGTNPSLITSRSFQLPEKSGTNPNLHWDKNIKTNLGIDMRFLDNRLSLTFDAYYDWAREMFDYPSVHVLPGTVGIYAAPENFGRMNMWGAEIQVGWRQRFNKDLVMNFKLGTGYDDNKVLETSWAADPYFTDKVYGQRTDRGLWGLSCIGMFRTYQQIEEYFEKYKITDYLGLSKDKVQPGMLIYEDIRGPKDENGNWTAPDGKISDYDDVVRISRRDSNPYNLNANININYKHFSLNATFQAEWGAYTMVPSGLRGESQGDMEKKNVSALWNDMFVYEDFKDADGNILAYANPNGKYPNIAFASQNKVNSTFWRMSAAEILLRNITVAYSLPKEWIKPLGMSSVRLNLTCQNAFSFYNAIPEGVWDNFAGSYGKYPTVRKITMGVNVAF